MPFVPSGNRTGAMELPPQMRNEEPIITNEEVEGSLIGAAVRTENTIGSALASEAFWTVDTVEEGFSPWALTQGTKYEAHWDRLMQARSRSMYEAIRTDIDREERDRQVLEEGGFAGFLAGMGAAVVDWPSLLPGGAIVRSASGSVAVGRSALMTSTAGAAGAGVQELALHQTQQTRTAGESAFAIGGSAVLAGLLGAGASGLFRRAEFKELAGRFNDELYSEEPIPADVNETKVREHMEAIPPADLSSTGAMAVIKDSLEDLTPSGAAARAAVDSIPNLNPILRLMHSVSPRVRAAGQMLFETPIYMKKNWTGGASDQAVETLLKEHIQGKRAMLAQKLKDEYSAATKEGYAGTRKEFNIEVGRASRRDDVGINDAVSRASKFIRDEVVNPLTKEAIDLGMLPHDISVSTAPSYFHRLYNSVLIGAREPEFRAILKEHFSEEVSRRVTQLTEKRDARVAGLGQQLDDLQRTGPDLWQTMARTKAEMQTHEQIHGRQWGGLEAELSSLRSKALAAKNAGDQTDARDFLDQIKQRKIDAGKEYADYVAKRNAYRSRLRSMRGSIASRQNEVDRLRDRIADMEEANINNLSRLHRSLSRLDEQIEGMAPETIEAELVEIKTKFLKIMARSEEAHTRLQNQKDRAAEAAQKDPSKSGDYSATLDKAQERFDQAEANRVDDLNKAAAKMEELDEADPTPMIEELQALIRTRLENAADYISRADERIRKDLDRIENKGPEAAERKIKEIKNKISKVNRDYDERVYRGYGKDDNYELYVDNIVDGVVAKILGRDMVTLPRDIKVAERGPLKERVLNIPDEKIEEFLVSDVEEVMDKFIRSMGSDVELTRKFGSTDMKDIFEEINADYQKARDNITADTKLSTEKKERAFKVLNDRQARDIRDLEAGRDMVRGLYMVDAQMSNYGRALSVVKMFNYLRVMGGVTISSLPDIARPMMVHGLGRYMNSGIRPLATNLKSYRLGVREGRLAGAVTETLLNTRAATFAEIMDPYGRGHPFERFMHNATKLFSKANFMVYWNDFMKSMATVLTQSRIIDNVNKEWGDLSDSERAYMLFLGIDEHMSKTIREQVARAATMNPERAGLIDDVWVAGTEMWDDAAATRVFRAALNKDVDSTIVTRGHGDIPLFAHTPTGQAVLQFKSFALASHQRVLIRGLQEGQSAFLSGIITAATVGMMVYFFKQMESNREISDNPGRWVSEGLDRSGIFSVMFEISNTSEKFGGPGIYTALQAVFPGYDQAGKASRYAIRNVTGSLMGPTAGIMEDVVRLYSAANSGEPLNKGDISAIRRLAPGTTLPLVRSGLEYGVMPWAYDQAD